MLVSLIFSFIILILGYYFPSFKESIAIKMDNINFSELLLEGMLSFMLFAGAIHGIRNPKGHDNIIQKKELRALEYLVFASLLCKRLGETKK